uniref:Uncharacterized protein n=1 Tax=Zooxanthella nutricula TaxID=1333877 RepID=A0A7S2KZ65_9DINO
MSYLVMASSAAPAFQGPYIMILGTVSMLATSILQKKGGGVQGWILAALIWAVTTKLVPRCGGRNHLVTACSMILLPAVFFTSSSKVQEALQKLPHSYAVFPVFAAAFRSVFGLLTRWVIVQFGPPDMNRWVPGTFLALQSLIASAFVMSSFVQLSKLPWPEAAVPSIGAVASTLVAEVFSRAPVIPFVMRELSGVFPQVPMFRVCKYLLPEQNTSLQTRFAMSYPVLVVQLIFVIPAVALGAPWARSVNFYIMDGLWFLTALTADAGVILVHRRFWPVAGETWLGTSRRLQQYGQHYPPFQKDWAERQGETLDELLAKDQASAQCAPTRTAFFPDELTSTMLLLAMVGKVLASSFIVTFGGCLTDPSILGDNCGIVD